MKILLKILQHVNIFKLLKVLFGSKLGLMAVVAAVGGGGYFTDLYGQLDRVQAMLGKEKRDILVDRVEDARDTQQEVKEQFQTALEKFKSVVNFDGGNLEAKYNELKAAHDRSAAIAKKISKRIDRVTSASNGLLDEWRQEILEYSSPELKRQSEEKFDATRERCDELITAMRRAEEKAQPVLDALSDQVLTLKHNLNSQAISALREEARTVEANVEDLIKDMEASIAEAEAFLATLEK